MQIIQRKNLALLLFVFSLIPTLVAVLLIVSAKHAEAQEALDARLATTSKASAFELRGDMERFRQILLTSAQNPAFTQVMLDPANHDTWKRQLNQSLLQLTTVFPGMIDEACRITPAGVELGRVVQGKVSPDANLSHNEGGNPFFKSTLDLAQGDVHYQVPYISPDTKRWVVSVSTPIIADGQNYGILHFEIPLLYYYQTLKSVLPDDGFLAMVSPDGQIYLTSGEGQPTDQPFPDLRSLSSDAGLSSVVPNILGGQSGFGGWNIGNTSYRMHYETVEIAPGFKTALVVGLPAVPGFASELSPFVFPILLPSLLLILIAAIVVSALSHSVSGYPGSEPDQKMTGRKVNVVPVLAISMIVAMASAYSIDGLHANVNINHQAHVLLVRIEGLAQQLNAQRPTTDADETKREASQVAETRSQTMQVLADLRSVDDSGSISQRTGMALRQYLSDVDELDKLYTADRDAEANLWNTQRVSQSYGALMGTLSDGEAVYNQAALRASTFASLGSAVALVLAALLMSFLFWRVEQARRAATQIAEVALRKSEQRFRSLVQNSSDVITIIGPDGLINYLSTSIEHVFGYAPGELVGKKLDEVVHPEDIPVVSGAIEEAKQEPGAVSLIPYRMLHSDGTWRHAETTVNNLLNDPDVSGLVLNTRDVSERKALEDELAYRAFHDSLTNLANRALFMDRLEHAMSRSARRTDSVAVLFLDLDGFKKVNDTLGHRSGDRLLTLVAQRLQTCLRPSDTVARIGGDEFTILLEDIASLGEAISVASRITEAMRLSFQVDGQDVCVSSSIGIALGTVVQDRPDSLLTNADAAMYEAKNAGKACYAIFDPDKKSDGWQRLQMETDMRAAIERKEFVLHYQPVLTLDSSAVNEVEALIRWQHPQRGLVSPGEFIPLAEETGLIVPIGKWVVEEACRQVKEWHAAYPGEVPLVVSVNLSAKQVRQQDLVRDVKHALEAAELDPQYLRLEITESTAMNDHEASAATLRNLAEMGVHLAVDDFGTGYSTLSYLKRYPVDTLKLDRSLIGTLRHDPADSAMVRAVIAFAKTLGLSITAEGIETAEQLSQLKQLGCDKGQGFYFARPLPVEKVWAFLSETSKQTAGTNAIADTKRGATHRKKASLLLSTNKMPAI